MYSYLNKCMQVIQDEHQQLHTEGEVIMIDSEPEQVGSLA